MKKSEIIDYLIEELVKDKKLIKENLLKHTDRLSLGLDGYALEIKLCKIERIKEIGEDNIKKLFEN